MTRTTPELAPPSPNFHATPTGGRLTTTHDLACNRPHTRRIFSGIGSRTWNPPDYSIKKSILIKGNVCVCVCLRCPDESIELAAMKVGTQVVVMVTECTSKPKF
ncbi:hypothetical protein AVEN_201378-1 [Araneus ventricosus]|uniref:Uncharacterized protein n=1 Tax=Araneus ventricosus TaxID=182803 RepID=A0A4Y2KY26_ARAVE|nr:hypothetical protein AVEN_245631-1 [Araneus ventricosus]GBN06947.1 hypothetical protein AVEN_141757-1 [Araneus ventricosus]GBN06949.1 hypothetical protein AVEN_153666-1 [Araneus ventricosus]GBN06970.1 hypothetical protein AVEN_201378-1 [Araneus ventricosus]